MTHAEWKEASKLQWLVGTFCIYRFQDPALSDEEIVERVKTVDRVLRREGRFSMIYDSYYIIYCGAYMNPGPGWIFLGQGETLAETMTLKYSLTPIGHSQAYDAAV